MHEYFGMSGTQLKWFESYLSNREQQCMVSGQISPPKNISCGIPQGSILGPLLFLLYINDMPKSLKYVTPSMYADDTEIFASSKHGDDLVANLNCDLENELIHALALAWMKGLLGKNILIRFVLRLGQELGL